MDLINEFASSDFVSSHPELHHYTSFNGLAAIHKSRTLWATNSRQLNDSKEIAILKGPLVQALTRRFVVLLEERQRKHAYVRKAIEETGGGVAGVAAGQAQKLVESFYETLQRNSAPLDFYVASFCTHADDPYARDNGLLSQWRGYGGMGDGGYCIVFDTAGLIDLLRQEFAAHYWVMPLRLGQVYYYTPDFTVEDMFAPLLNESDKLLSALIDQTEIPEIVMAYFLWAAPLLKHQGFREEREARIVAVPGTRHDLDGLRAEHGDVSVPPLKTILSRGAARGPRQYVELFESFRPALPIKRVIVGPSIDQEANVKKAESLFVTRITIVRSDTPFIG